MSNSDGDPRYKFFSVEAKAKWKQCLAANTNPKHRIALPLGRYKAASTSGMRLQDNTYLLTLLCAFFLSLVQKKSLKIVAGYS